jgi:hypothetical protein
VEDLILLKSKYLPNFSARRDFQHVGTDVTHQPRHLEAGALPRLASSWQAGKSERVITGTPRSRQSAR